MAGARAAEGDGKVSADGASIGDDPRKAARPQEPPAYVIVFHEDSPDRIYVITSRVIHIGRDYDVDIRLLSESVSARHARIVNLGTAFEVEDLNSTNGTFVRGNRVAKTTLKSGD